jgi:S-adenosylhomocysteine hydrolase
VTIQTWTALGADVRSWSSNIFTQDHATAAIECDSAAVFASLQEDSTRTLDWGHSGGPDLIVEDGRNATLPIHEGMKAEEISKKTGKVPARVKGKKRFGLFHSL